MGNRDSKPLSNDAEKKFLAAIKSEIIKRYSDTIQRKLQQYFDGFAEIGKDSARGRNYKSEHLLKYYQELFYLLVKKYTSDTKQLQQSMSETKEIRVEGSPEQLLNSLQGEASSSSTTDNGTSTTTKKLWKKLCGEVEENLNGCREYFKSEGNALINDVFGSLKGNDDHVQSIEPEGEQHLRTRHQVDKFTLRRSKSATPFVMLRRGRVFRQQVAGFNYFDLGAVLVVPFEGEYQKNPIRGRIDTWNYFEVDALMLLGEVRLKGSWDYLHPMTWPKQEGLSDYEVLVQPPLRESQLTVSHLTFAERSSFLQTRSFETFLKDAGNVHRVEGGVKVSPANSKTAGLIPAEEQTDVETFGSASASSSTAVSGHGAVHDHVSNKVMENTLRSAQLQADTSSISGSITTDIRAAGADTPTPDEHEVCEQEGGLQDATSYTFALRGSQVANMIDSPETENRLEPNSSSGTSEAENRLEANRASGTSYLEVSAISFSYFFTPVGSR
ncbi:unnamed protein product [Amoebophrya sp. A25]|nr:unnamed protein product [Amoebophrya sp. A25]|eukprot:GSA25T00002764001.1